MTHDYGYCLECSGWRSLRPDGAQEWLQCGACREPVRRVASTRAPVVTVGGKVVSGPAQAGSVDADRARAFLSKLHDAVKAAPPFFPSV